MSCARLELAKSASTLSQQGSESDRILRAALSTILEHSEHRSWSDSWISVEELSEVASLKTTLDAAQEVMDNYFGRNDSAREQGITVREMPEPTISSSYDAFGELSGSESFASAKSGCSSSVKSRGRGLRKISSVIVQEDPELVPTSDDVQKELAYPISQRSEDAGPPLTTVRSLASAPSKLGKSSSKSTKLSPTTGGKSIVTSTSQSLDTLAALEWKRRVQRFKSKLRQRIAEKQKSEQTLDETTLPTILEDNGETQQWRNKVEGLSFRSWSSTKNQLSSLASETTGSLLDSLLESNIEDDVDLSNISIQCHGMSMLSSIDTESTDDYSNSVLTDGRTFLSASSQIASLSDDSLPDKEATTMPIPELTETNFQSFSSEEDCILTIMSSNDLSCTQIEPLEQVDHGLDKVQAQTKDKMNLLGLMVLESEDRSGSKLVNAILSDATCTIETALIDMNSADELNNENKASAEECSAAIKELVEGSEMVQDKRDWWFRRNVGRRFRDGLAKGSSQLSS